MDELKRIELEKRREEQQKIIEQNERSESLRTQIDYLDENGFEYDVLFDQPATEWMFKHLDIRQYGTGIDWEEMGQPIIEHFDTDHERNMAVNDILGSRLGSKDKITVVYSNGFCPEFRISVETFQSAPDIFIDSFQVWILAEDKKLVIEILQIESQINWQILP